MSSSRSINIVAGDSTYKPITDYITPSGTRQTVVYPFTDFKNNVLGAPFDFVHFKDFTLVNMMPVNAQFRFFNISLVGDCAVKSTPTVVSKPGTTNVPTGVLIKSASTTAPKSNGALSNGMNTSMMLAGLVGLVSMSMIL